MFPLRNHPSAPVTGHGVLPPAPAQVRQKEPGLVQSLFLPHRLAECLPVLSPRLGAGTHQPAGPGPRWPKPVVSGGIGCINRSDFWEEDTE